MIYYVIKDGRSLSDYTDRKDAEKHAEQVGGYVETYIDTPISVSKFEPNLGDFLYGIPSSEESAKYHPEDERVFIYNGHKSGDGWGMLIGFEDHRIVKTTEWNNFMWGGDIRPATETEVIQFMNRVMHQNNIFDR